MRKDRGEDHEIEALILGRKSVRNFSRAFVDANTAPYPAVEPVFSIWLAVPESGASRNGERSMAVRDNIARAP